MEEENRNCGHDACVCTLNGDDDYCSIHCKDAADQDLVEIRCDCGHSCCA